MAPQAKRKKRKCSVSEGWNAQPQTTRKRARPSLAPSGSVTPAKRLLQSAKEKRCASLPRKKLEAASCRRQRKQLGVRQLGFGYIDGVSSSAQFFMNRNVA